MFKNMDGECRVKLYRIISAAVFLGVFYFLPTQGVLRLALFLIPYLIVGWDVLAESVKNIAHGEIFDENFLMSIATIGAFALGDYPEAVFVMLFYQTGDLAEELAEEHSRRSVADMMNIRPDYANVERDGATVRVPPEEVRCGTVITVLPGERIPIDGRVISGESSLDTSSLTGEASPVDVCAGDEALGGCVNINGVLKLETTREYSESTAAVVLRLIEESSEKKSKTERFITKFARVYTPAVIAAAVLIALGGPLLFNLGWHDGISRALIFLVVSCPCAVVISVPLSYFGGIGGASKSGIIIKGADCLERLARVGTVAFDKTGTLTTGSFLVTEAKAVGIPQRELVYYAACAECFSPHPISRAVTAFYGGEADTGAVSEYREIPGMGVTALVNGARVYAGNRRLMEKTGVQAPDDGLSVYVAIDGVYRGGFVCGDEVRAEAKEALARLKNLGVKTVMLTGDNEKNAARTAQLLGLDDYRSQLLPQDKAACMQELIKSSEGATVFVGDGLNDAPVLALADVGAAMGALGTDAAIESADIVLMNDDLRGVPRAMEKAKKTRRIVIQNITLALGIKALVLVLGALGLSSMWAAVFADVGVSVIAILNALRCLNVEK